MISTSDNSSTDEEDSQELQRLKDAAVTLEPSGGDLHASEKVPANIRAMNEVANSTKAPQSRRSSRPSLRPKQTYSEDSSELKTTPGFRTHVAKKLSDILDKELQFSESAVEKCSEKQKSSKSGIRLLSSSKKFLKIDPNTVPDTKLSKWNLELKPKSHCKSANSISSTNRKRANPNSNKQTDSSSDSSEDELLAEAAVSIEDIKKKDELLSSFAITRAPILVIRADKADNAKLKKKRNPENDTEAKMNENPVKKKKKNKKHEEKKENSLKEGNED